MATDRFEPRAADLPMGRQREHWIAYLSEGGEEAWQTLRDFIDGARNITVQQVDRLAETTGDA